MTHWLDPTTWELDVETARSIYREDQAALKKRRTRRVKNLYAMQVAQLIDAALAGGAVREAETTFRWDVSGECANPSTIETWSSGIGGRVVLLVPCRTGCEPCLAQRRRLWSARALDEARAACRTWLATLTVRPEELYKAQCAARMERERAGVSWEDLTPGEQFGLKSRHIGYEVTKWLKRVRKRCGEEWTLQGVPSSAGAIRYLLVVEAHKSGEPHYHLLMHETSEWASIRYDWLKLAPRENGPQIDAQWGLGFSAFKLIPADKATYATKYLSKSLLARVRASKGYGERTISDAPNRGEIRPTNTSF